jgi:shikimate kinase
MLVVILGYMGSGKSSVGQIVAQKLGIAFLDLDDVIAEKEGCSVAEIFKSKGEIYFRKKETEHLRKLLEGASDLVLALGGGTPCYSNNMELINSTTAISVYLKTSISSLFERLKSEKNERPLINHLKSDEDLVEFIGKHLFERQNYYRQAKQILTTDSKSIEVISDELIALL